MNDADIVVAGHICIDLIPEFPQQSMQLEELLQPGKLTQVGAATVSTGGAVSNTGIALHKLGVSTQLIGKIGDDLFGKAILDVLQSYGKLLSDTMIIDNSESSSYTLVISPPGIDRLFFHNPGANNAFDSSDISAGDLQKTRLFHFGYPPIMQRMFENQGHELVALFEKVKNSGITTSLDMAFPDPDSSAGRADWQTILKKTLPLVDIFLPSLDEIAFMLNHEWHTDDQKVITEELLRDISGQLLDYGAKIVVLKLGDQGLYLRTSSEISVIENISLFTGNQAENWIDREILTPCYRTTVAGTTGAGDCTIAGFLAGLIHGQSPEATTKSSVGVGAFNVEKPDSVSGIPDWKTVQNRVDGGWKILENSIKLKNLSWNDEWQIWK